MPVAGRVGVHEAAGGRCTLLVGVIEALLKVLQESLRLLVAPHQTSIHMLLLNAFMSNVLSNKK